jgi:NAD(P)H-dependent FMN reductase
MTYSGHTMKLSLFFSMLIAVVFGVTGCSTKPEQEPVVISTMQVGQPMHLQIIVGSVRHTTTGEKIAENIRALLNKRPEIVAEIVKIADYNLPFYVDETSPSMRKGEITDPVLKKWSDKINGADGYIIIAPEYNAGYPGPLKNALDSLYKEWNNKPVVLVGYSGGPSGGVTMLAQLRKVVEQGLEMLPVATDITIPQSWKAFDEQGKLVNSNFEHDVNRAIDLLLEAKKR